MDNSSADLMALRKKIDKLDAGILSLLDERTRMAGFIAEAKKKAGIGLTDLNREEELYTKLKELNKKTVIPDDHMIKIWGKIIELNKSKQEGS